MLRNETASKLYELKMGTMAQAFMEQMQSVQYQELPFEDRFAMLVDAEWHSRKSNRIARLIRNAGYSLATASIEDLSYNPDRKLNKTEILRLASCSYIEESRNIIIQVATGAGKTYLACALGIAANKNCYASKYIRLPDILVEIAMARGNGTYRDVMQKYKKIPLLILDEWLLYPLKEDEARDLLELIETRNQNASTIFCTQLGSGGWHEYLHDALTADAICDRIVNNAYMITIEGESMRKLNAPQPLCTETKP